MINLINLNDIAATKPSFLLETILPIQEREINLFSSVGGGGKSWTLLKTLALLNTIEKKRVFGWFSEDESGVTKHRLEILKNADTTITNAEIIVTDDRARHFIEYDRNRNLVVTDFFNNFKEQMKEFDVICLDPLIAFYGADENDNVQARFFTDLLNEWCKKENKTILMIHHHSKGENGAARGASAFVDAVRIHYEVTKKENNDSDRFLVLKKTNHYNGKSEFRINLFRRKIEVTYENISKNESNIIILDDEEETEEEINKVADMKQRGFSFDE